MKDELAEAIEALADAAAHLIGAASAYSKYAGRAPTIRPRAIPDPFFTTRSADFKKAADRAQAALAKLRGGENQR